MKKDDQTFFTDRQLEVLKLRRQGLVQREVARRLDTSRANVSILEKHAYEKVRRAKATLDLFNKMNMAVQVIISPKTKVRDIPRLIFKKADEANIKMRINNPSVLGEVTFKASDKMIVVSPITVTILPDGTIAVE
ncbi:MAG: Tfx family DNA-binding protein [Candidatus Hodarchaeota archaeon]